MRDRCEIFRRPAGRYAGIRLQRGFGRAEPWQWQTLAETDALTGLANRRVFAARFAQASAECEREQLPISLVMLDIDHFKKINDYWSHASGDIVLRAVADVLRHHVRKDDQPARLGGEEFAVLLARTRLDEAAAVAEKLRELLLHLDALLMAADQRLYVAKSGGRNTVLRH